MTRRKRTKANRKGKPPEQEAGSLEVHVKIAYAEGNLAAAGSLVKPALLYADRVTIYSPVASMVRSVTSMASIKGEAGRTLAALELIDQVPSLREELGAEPKTIEMMKLVLGLTSAQRKAVLSMAGAPTTAAEVERALDEISKIWEEKMPAALERIKETAGVGDLDVAINGGALEIAELDLTGESGVIADALRSATGDPGTGAVDKLAGGFVARTVEMLTEARSFPLLDASSAGLVRALESEAGLLTSDVSVRRGSEIHAATGFMGFLPYFPLLPMDEILDLRSELRTPLTRFRGEMATLATEFERRPFDEGFAAEVEDAWRRRIEPALMEIREALAQHGLLREAASIATGDPKRILTEAGGVVVAAHADLLSLSGLMTAGLAAGVPLADVAVRALRAVFAARRDVRRNACYFLHKLGEEARTRTA